MRESFGSAFMIKIMLVFIVVYVSFMAVAINYAKAFRVKNQVINILEQRQYQPGDVNTISDVENYLNRVSYNYNNNQAIQKDCGNRKGVFIEQGVCIVERDNNESSLSYYQVITYFVISFPFFDINMTVPISGETKAIYRD